MEPHLQDKSRHLDGATMIEQDAGQRRYFKKNSKVFHPWHCRLLGRTKNCIRTVLSQEPLPQILQSCHDDIQNWDITATRQFFLYRYWWPFAHPHLFEYVRGFVGCQKRHSYTYAQEDSVDTPFLSSSI